ncbi:MAG: Tungsten-containing formylmethanofuran dehydrogenase 2 subunit B [Candidatus Thorarchaeota archaeon]|nr:MAG: Tungsten-containing formylmethanofuran dehydrogenase 2 subunit B [Candidatus Thorarchaeota archaeon]
MGISIPDVVCPFCGCLCDDLIIHVDNGRIIKNEHGCAISKSKFLHHLDDRLEHPEIRDGDSHQTVELKTAISHCVDLLKNARRPLIYGLSSVENDAHREAYKIADLVGAIVDNTSSVCHGPTILGTQESGEAAGSLAEVKNRADLVIYWGSNPQFAHPRHISRFVKPPGEFIHDPRTDREVWVFDIRKSITATLADRFVKVEPGRDLEVLSALRALVRGHEIDVSEVGGVPIDTIRELAERMKSAKYGILFFGLGLTQSHGRHHNVDAAIRLVQDLNSYTKWNMMSMRGHYNVAGANKTLTWTTGYPFAVDFSRGFPRYQPGEYTAVDLLRRGEVDVLLNIGADPVAHFPKVAVSHIRKIPVINIDPKRNLTSLFAEVNIPTAIAGIECDGAAVRMDGLPLYLKKVMNPPEGIIPDREVLQMIYEQLEEVMQ